MSGGAGATRMVSQVADSALHVTNVMDATNRLGDATATLGANYAGAGALAVALSVKVDKNSAGTEDARVIRATGDKFVFTLPTAVDVFKVIDGGAHVLNGSLFTGSIKPVADGTTAIQIKSTSGTSIVNIDTTNGRVGIGTSAPLRQIHVGSANTVSVVKLTNSTTTEALAHGLDIQMVGTAAYLWNYEDGPLYFAVNNASVLTLNSTRTQLVNPLIMGSQAIVSNTGAGGVVAIKTTTLPTAATADYAWLAEQDAAGAAGKGALHFRSENMGSTDWAIVSGFVYKTTTGDYAVPHEGLGCINTVDNNIKIYADGAWRTLVTWT